MRAFAKPAPQTMSQEHQEAANEMLKVCEEHHDKLGTLRRLLIYAVTETKSRSHHRHLLRQLHWQRPGPVSPEGQLKTLGKHDLVSFVI